MPLPPFLWLINLLEKSIKNNRRDEKINFSRETKSIKFPARYDYDSIDIHDGSWLSPIEFFFRILIESNQRPWRYWGSEKYACKKSLQDWKLISLFDFLHFFLLSLGRWMRLNIDKLRMCLFCQSNFLSLLLKCQKWRISHVNGNKG